MTTINGRACIANGRNLLTGTNNTLTTVTDSTGWGTGLPRYQPAETLKANQTYTASCYLEPSAHDVAILAKTANGIVTGTVIAAGSKGISTLTITLTQEDVKIANSFWISFLSQQTDKSAVSFKGFKLEKGSYATPWSPTPVDKVFSNGRQVYGRNLLLGVNKDIRQASDSWQWVTNVPTEFNKVGQPLCFSVLINNAPYAESLISGRSFCFIQARDSSGVLSEKSGNSINFNADGISQASLIVPDKTQSIKLYVVSDNMLKNTHYGYPKIEFGDIATPWTPAPEDVM